MAEMKHELPHYRQELLKQIPSITELLKSPTVQDWLARHPAPLVTDCLRRAVALIRNRILTQADEAGQKSLKMCQAIVHDAGQLLNHSIHPRIHHAINATGIILHTGLGRAVFAPAVVDSMADELKGYCTLAIDPITGERAERDELLEPILTQLTGAEAATVVNNNAAATMLVLAALAAEKEVIVSRGQLIEIGGSFRLPEVMAQSRARLVEVGATNRTHLKDYHQAITPQTAALMRVHPSNYRVVGFVSEVELRDLAELAHSRQLILIDDLGAGALVGLEMFGLPHEFTVQESVMAGADITLFSGDKLIGGSQAGVIVGRKDLIQRLRRHPLMRAVRADKSCLMMLERTLHLFWRPECLRETHPTYQMMSTPLDQLRAQARALIRMLEPFSTQILASIQESTAFLGSGSLPTQAIPSIAVAVTGRELSATELARRLRMHTPCIFGRIEEDQVILDMRTMGDRDIPIVAAALQHTTS